MNLNEQTIRRRDLVKVFLRSFLIQASWSFAWMQSLGFAYAMQPVLKRLYPDPEEYRSRLRLHQEYFNTQPYLAAFIVGAAVKAEQNRAFGRNGDGDVTGLKSSLMAPLGALGDSFFWGSLMPLAGVIAFAFLVTGAWWAPLLFLIVFNSWHIGLRAAVFVWGYRSAGDAVALMSHYRFTMMARLFKVISLAVMGGAIGMASLWSPELNLTASSHVFAAPFAGLTITLGLVAFLRGGGSPVKLMLGLAGICLALAYIGVV